MTAKWAQTGRIENRTYAVHDAPAMTQKARRYRPIQVVTVTSADPTGKVVARVVVTARQIKKDGTLGENQTTISGLWNPDQWPDWLVDIAADAETNYKLGVDQALTTEAQLDALPVGAVIEVRATMNHYISFVKTDEPHWSWHRADHQGSAFSAGGLLHIYRYAGLRVLR